MKSNIAHRILVGLTVVGTFAGLLKLSEPSILAALGLDEKRQADDIANIENFGDAVYWNERANEYLHTGPISKVFSSYEKAVALAPEDATIRLNFGNALFVYRNDSMAFYHLDEQQVFDAAFRQFDQAIRLDPTNFELATDIATSYYAVKPFRYQAALAAWKRTEALAESDFERQGVQLHLARVEINAGNRAVASELLTRVTGFRAGHALITRSFRARAAPPGRSSAPPPPVPQSRAPRRSARPSPAAAAAPTRIS
jgi:tetratricopeptide (TPR) repeat protein